MVTPSLQLSPAPNGAPRAWCPVGLGADCVGAHTGAVPRRTAPWDAAPQDGFSRSGMA